MSELRAVVFDLGGVLVDWNPRYLYRSLFAGDDARMEWFLRTVCTQEWNEKQDGGRSWAEAVADLSRTFPAEAELIEAYDRRWEEMLGAVNLETVAIVDQLWQRGVPLYALSNWSAEKFPIARRRYAFLERFSGIVVSGEVKLKKPDPAIFNHLVNTYSLHPAATLFIDDMRVNVEAAQQLGFVSIHFRSAAALADELAWLGLR